LSQWFWFPRFRVGIYFAVPQSTLCVGTAFGIPTLELSSLYTSPTERENTVIPAWMPESSAMDGNWPLAQVFESGEFPARSFTSL